MDRAVTQDREAASLRVFAVGLLGGLLGGIVMAMWQMLYSAGRGDGFWSPLNVCMASFVYRSDARMMVDDMMMHPGMSMNEPVQASHLAVGAGLHLAFSAIVGIAFALVLWELARTSLRRLLSKYWGYVAASVAGGVILYLVMWYLVLPWANPPFKDLALRGPFFVAHVVYGLGFGLVAFPMLHRMPRTTDR